MNLKKLAILPAAFMLFLTGCGKQPQTAASLPDTEVANSQAYDGNLPENAFIISLYPEYAPITCENFEKLVSKGFYDGLTFHRVYEGFMAQGGDPDGTGAGGSPDTIKGEFKSNGVNNTLSHKRGIVSMARTKVPDSASSQFFICYTDCSASLDGDYAAFGEVTEGMEVVDNFLKVERDYNGERKPTKPRTPIIIESAKMIDKDKDGHSRVLVQMKDFLAGAKGDYKSKAAVQ